MTGNKEADQILLDLTSAWALGRLSYAELPASAASLLACGLDSPGLRELAGQMRPNFWATERVFVRTMSELGVEKPTPGPKQGGH